MLCGKYVTLKIMESKDSETVRAWKNSPDNYMHFANRKFISDVKQEAWYSKTSVDSRNMHLIIHDNDKNIPIGVTLLESIDHRNRNAVWGIYIGDIDYRKKIYAIEATYLLLEYAFDYLNLQKIYGNTLADNPRGRRFHQFVGFTEEAVFSNHIYANGEYQDLLWIRLFRSEWESKKIDLKQYVENYGSKSDDV
jgi:UDP-4-amino-4,6-dideoxy-N-acetyl-beta-L-altrosamine N-acetyltransferase